MNEDPQFILWRRFDEPGHDACRIVRCGVEWHIAGTALFSYEGEPCELHYLVRCDAEWRTLGATVSGWIGGREVALDITADHEGAWRLNGDDVPGVAGCVDIDLNFTPATNTISLRRLGFPEGETVRVTTAWLRFPDLALLPLDQFYRRTGEETFGYEVPELEFTAELRVSRGGVIVEYGELWRLEAGTSEEKE